MTVQYVIFAGDFRANEQPSLTSLHTLWLREHNRIAKKLEYLYGSKWDDEKIFQEARKIVGALFQHITYNEFLPVVLGKQIMKLFDLEPKYKGEYFKKYNPKVNPNHRQGFMTAAFRFGHSLINDRLGFKLANGKYTRRQFRELFFKPNSLYQPEGLEQLLRGLCVERSQIVDRYVTIYCCIGKFDLFMFMLSLYFVVFFKG
jgi:peroxidase